MGEQKTVSRSSTETLEKDIELFQEESGQSKAEIYRRAHSIYISVQRDIIKHHLLRENK